MAEEKAEKKPQLPKLRDEKCAFVYSNGVTIVNTKYDLQIIFGQLVLQPNNQFAVYEHTIVAMSPQHAKALHVLLEKRLKAWEEKYGSIVVETGGVGETLIETDD